MGFFSGNKPRAKGRNGNNQSKGQACPRHGRYNSYSCDAACRSIIIGNNGGDPSKILDDGDQRSVDPSNGWW